MYYDLCIPYSSSSPDLQRTLSFLVELSYSTAAVSLPPPSNLLTSTKPPTQLPPLPTPPPGLKRILTRLTLPLYTPSDLPHAKLSHLQQAYDLVALRPTSEKTLLLATSAPDVDLISLDLSARWPFHFRPKMFAAATKRGIWFEICYSPALNPSNTTSTTKLNPNPNLTTTTTTTTTSNNSLGDLIPAPDQPTARRNIISNGTSLIRALRGGGRNLIFSSDARDGLGLRAPMDVVVFGMLMGLSREMGIEAVRDGPACVVRAARARRDGWRGVVLGVCVAGSDSDLGRSMGVHGDGGLKRKILHDGDGNADGGDGGAQDGEGALQQSQQEKQKETMAMSKRQMKRLARQAKPER